MSAIAAIGSINLTKPILVSLINFSQELEEIGSLFLPIKKKRVSTGSLSEGQMQ